MTTCTKDISDKTLLTTENKATNQTSTS